MDSARDLEGSCIILCIVLHMPENVLDECSALLSIQVQGATNWMVPPITESVNSLINQLVKKKNIPKNVVSSKGRPRFTQISVLGPILAYMRRCSLLSSTGRYSFYTD